MVVKIRVPLWVPIIVRHLLLRAKRGHNFDNHPYGFWGHIDCLVLSREWGNGLWGLLLEGYIGSTIGIHSPIPY